ncbi:MAG: DegT/DnrJ/EryC1/StrS aminotransferase family protein [Spirochaetales bacterium]|nr:DegT/DnrJ/EryC1/StrS aminotransferase family protein [Spirochaetales bacterium]
MKRKPIPFSAPKIGLREIVAAGRILRSGWLTTGQENSLFEEEFAQKTGSPYALSVNSATSALHLILEALGVGLDDWVITTPYTFTASAEILRYLGAHPLFADVDGKTGNIDPSEIERILHENAHAPMPRSIKAILPVHLAGLPCDMDRIMDISRRYDIPVVEDCAHAFPVRYYSTTDRSSPYLGTIGAGGAFSFYANKTITTGEGGMVTVGDEALKERISLMRLHGIDRDVWNRYSSSAGHLSWQYDIKAPGYKYNLTNFQAAIGRVQLKKAERFKRDRTNQALLYNEAFHALDSIETPIVGKDHAWHIYIIKIKPEKLTSGRDEFIKALFDRGINCSVHYRPLHMMSYYRDTYGFMNDDFPRALDLYERTISLPLYPGLGIRGQKRVIRAVIEVSRMLRRTE